MTKETITFRTNHDRRKKLDRMAALMNRDRTYVLNEAIDAWLDLVDWQARHIERGLAAADAGDFTEEAAVRSTFERARSRAGARAIRSTER